MFKGIFRKRPKRLSKQEYWEKWEFFEIIKDLHLAEKMLKQCSGGYSGEFLSSEDFLVALIDEIDDVEFGNKTDLNKFWQWFAPTCAWDDFVGENGQSLGDRIFARVNKWKNNHTNTNASS